MYKTFRREEVVRVLVLSLIIGACLWLINITFGTHL